MKKIILFAFVLIGFSLQPILVAQQPLEITREAFLKSGAKPIPVTMSGFTGEVDAVLRFDLSVAGFEFVSASPQFLISGRNNGNVEGQLHDAIGKNSLLSKMYSGGSLRSQAHALANDIILAITGQKGIAGTKIAFKMDSGSHSEIYVADYDGHGATAVTADNNDVSGPCWVSGQRRLLYGSWKNGGIQIFSHDLSTGSRRVLAGFPGSNHSPAVSPDGRRVAMILGKTGNPELFVCNLDGSGLAQLTRTKEDESSPCWSPDGSRICYVSRFNTRPAMFIISASGGEPQRVRIAGVAGQLTEPDWSPDGKTIVFTAQMGSFNICTVPAGGGGAEILTTGEDPSWAPNSRTVIFTRRTNNKRVLSLLDVPTKRVKDVAQISGSGSQASWCK